MKHACKMLIFLHLGIKNAKIYIFPISQGPDCHRSLRSEGGLARRSEGGVRSFCLRFRPKVWVHVQQTPHLAAGVPGIKSQDIYQLSFHDKGYSSGYRRLDFGWPAFAYNYQTPGQTQIDGSFCWKYQKATKMQIDLKNHWSTQETIQTILGKHVKISTNEESAWKLFFTGSSWEFLGEHRRVGEESANSRWIEEPVRLLPDDCHKLRGQLYLGM